MVSISHPSMKKSKSAPKEEVKQTENHFVVDDATSDGFQEEVEFAQEVKEKAFPSPKPPAQVAEPEKIPPVKRKLLEELLFLGRVTRDVEIGGINFEISTLSHKEKGKLLKHLYAMQDGADLLAIRTTTLAFALRTAQGVPVEELEVDEHFETPFDKKLYVVENMQDSVIDKLHSEYEKLVESSDQNVSGEDVKN